MQHIHLESIGHPLDKPGVALVAARLVSHVAAMGLLPHTLGEIRTLDGEIFTQLLKELAHRDIARNSVVKVLDKWPEDPGELRELLNEILLSLADSPVPASEWKVLTELFDPEPSLLSGLLGISESSLRRYARGERPTPDEVAARLHFLALVVSDLSGAYNEIGIRRWFRRKRAALGKRSPAELLRGNWAPESRAARKVKELVESLLASPAT